MRHCDPHWDRRTVLCAVTAGHGILVDPVPAGYQRLIVHRKHPGRARLPIEYCWHSVYVCIMPTACAESEANLAAE